MTPPIIYNLFPRLAGKINTWITHAKRARNMGFNWLFLNPVTQPGFSGSLYSVREYDRIYSKFLPEGASEKGFDELRTFIDDCHKLGLKVMMDLVINHTAIDSPLTKKHPEWYKRDNKGTILNPFAVDPEDSRKKTVWGDLAEIDNEDSPDREELWEFWKQLVSDSLEVGFDGFRCDAAYKVPAKLWKTLVTTAHQQKPGSLFFAETLGCRIDEVTALQETGLNYLFNSSKYWMFDANWAIKQHGLFGQISPSISFPESHDTDRLMAYTKGNQAVQRQRYLFATLFSEGVMLPMGYEFGFCQKMDVVKSTPKNWENTEFNMSSFIAAANHFKISTPVFQEEGKLRTLTDYFQPTLILEKSGNQQTAMIVINKDWNHSNTVDLSPCTPADGMMLVRFGSDGSIWKEGLQKEAKLGPAEIAIIL